MSWDKPQTLRAYVALLLCSIVGIVIGTANLVRGNGPAWVAVLLVVVEGLCFAWWVSRIRECLRKPKPTLHFHTPPIGDDPGWLAPPPDREWRQ